MNKKIIVILIIIAIAISAFLAFSQYDKENGGNKETFNVSSEGPISLSDIVEDINCQWYIPIIINNQVHCFIKIFNSE